MFSETICDMKRPIRRQSQDVVPRRAIKADFAAWSSQPEAIDEICAAITDSPWSTLGAWCKSKGFKRLTVSSWIRGDQSRVAAYELAIRARADLMVEHSLELAHEAPERKNGRIDLLAHHHRRMQVETLQWLAAQLHPTMYRTDAR